MARAATPITATTVLHAADALYRQPETKVEITKEKMWEAEVNRIAGETKPNSTRHVISIVEQGDHQVGEVIDAHLRQAVWTAHFRNERPW